MNPQHDKFQALEEAMEEYGELLLRLAITYVKNHAIAEDLVQDVFVKAFEKLADYREDASYKTYLCKLTVNRCHDHFRSWHYKNTQMTEWWGRFVHPSASTESEMIRKDESSELGQKIFELPIKYREVIVLHYYQELSVSQMASILGISENTVKTRLKRGRERLKLRLEEEWYDERQSQKSY